MKSFIGLLLIGSMLVIFACKNPSPVIHLNPYSAADSSNFTEIQWLDTIVNFGTIPIGETKVVTFRMRNIGNKPLTISNVQAGCSCTVPDYTKEAIPPGGVGFVMGSFDSNKAHPGEVRKSIFVTTNSKNGINKTLIFTGIIESANAAANSSKKL
ncbi:MAG: DUF1573 domain-containing protein [Bacteroidota bacterium]